MSGLKRGDDSTLSVLRRGWAASPELRKGAGVTIFLALLGKQCGVTPQGWREVAGAYGEDGARRSIADVTSQESMLEVRAYKQSVKAAAKASKQ